MNSSPITTRHQLYVEEIAWYERLLALRVYDATPITGRRNMLARVAALTAAVQA